MPSLEVAYLKEIRELYDKLQYVIDWMDRNKMLPDHMFTFPDGDSWLATGEDDA